MKKGIDDKKSKKRNECIVCYDYPTGLYSQWHDSIVFGTLKEALEAYSSDIFSEKYHKRQGIIIKKFDENGDLQYSDFMDHDQVLKMLK